MALPERCIAIAFKIDLISCGCTNAYSLNGDVYDGRSYGNFGQSENHFKSQKL
ncbi:MAG: hypothetical protein V7L21_13285 [Nostoc sp.]|uniref:hypothetical protein n=1 Tax=unclassified Nostoc TaxID=2593658 RepID=UPI0025DAA2E9|nr:hypothetical protein [Nostoc sp. NMS9]MBN3940681.1 hypothetical protein [Nostoc sp. NMS9]